MNNNSYNRICDIIEAKGYTIHMTKDGRVVMKSVKANDGGFIGKAFVRTKAERKILADKVAFQLNNARVSGVKNPDFEWVDGTLTFVQKKAKKVA